MEFTSLWVFWQKYRGYAGLVIIGTLLFGIGWQLGKVTSPYYAASPIVFNEIKGDNIPVSDLNSLETIKEQGIAQRKPSTAPAVAGTTTTTQGAFVASKNSNLYHHVSCATAKRISPSNLLTFATSQEAEKAGFTPSVCAKTYLQTH